MINSSNKNSIEIDDSIYKVLKLLITKLAKYDRKNVWLFDLLGIDDEGCVNIKSVHVKLSKIEECGTMGSFNITDQNTVFLYYMTDFNQKLSLKYNQWMIVSSLFDTLIHELRHMYQYRTSKILYIVNRFVTLLLDLPWQLFGYADENHLKDKNKMDFKERIVYCLRYITIERDADEYGTNAVGIEQIMNMMNSMTEFSYKNLNDWKTVNEATEDDVKLFSLIYHTILSEKTK